MFYLHPNIKVFRTKTMGNGIKAKAAIEKGTLLEVSPVVVMDAQARILLDQTLMHDYIFVWGDNEDQCCVALGYISIYNHSYSANAEYEMDFDNNTITISTVRDIAKGEEITINYNGDHDNKKPIWFDAKPIQ
ncbi:MAG: hypothetical protein RL660_746 [Bacteroidota bacterium]